MDYQKLYDAMTWIVAELEEDHDVPELQRPDYRKIKALAAGYEMMDYLANRISAEVSSGKMSPPDGY